ncbi:MAG: crossover junction endodeoxyribonuclease RuvC [Alphaproteobacteria bacterium]|nr:crossover junction endodeoxyribonuclease RuvC [Alphaproteobacteria bacterium]
MRILGLDPGLRHTGWGIIDKSGSAISFVAAGVISADTDLSLADRLAQIHASLVKIITEYAPQEAAIEETFVNVNPTSTLKLGQARGVAMLTPALYKIPVAEYTPNQIKKMVVGVGHAAKPQVDMMVKKMMPTLPDKLPPDAADALAIALCHGFMRKIIK